MKKPSLLVWRQSLLNTFKSFVRPNLDYADIVYNKPHKGWFIKNRMGAIQSFLSNTWMYLKKTSLSRIRVGVTQK